MNDDGTFRAAVGWALPVLVAWALLAALWPQLPQGCRVVVNAVTLQSEALLTTACAQYGGALMRVDIAHAVPLGRMTGWQAARPIVQWSVQR